jgi:aspartate/methionine/tyrosine aminotransferase
MHGIRTRYLYDTFVELRIPCAEPMGGFYVFPSFKKWQKVLATRGVYTDEDLAVYLLEQYGLATLPGAAFNTRPEDLYLRLSSSYIDAGTDQKAEALLAAFRKDPDPERFIAQYHPRMQEVANRLANFVNDLKED